MTELSPAANAVLTAVTLTRYDVPPEGLPAFAEEMAPLLPPLFVLLLTKWHQRGCLDACCEHYEQASVTSCSHR
jgi:hypothetical protein